MGLLEGEGRFDHGGDEAGGDVPFDVAVEEPDAWRGGGNVSLRGGLGDGERERGNLSGLLARKRNTMFPFGRTVKVSLRIGTAGKVSFPM